MKEIKSVWVGDGLHVSVIEKAQLDIFLGLALEQQWESNWKIQVAESNEEATAILFRGSDWNTGRVC